MHIVNRQRNRLSIEITASGWHILKLKCTKFDFGWFSAPGPGGGVYSFPSDTLAAFQGPTSKGKGEDVRD